MTRPKARKTPCPDGADNPALVEVVIGLAKTHRRFTDQQVVVAARGRISQAVDICRGCLQLELEERKIARRVPMPKLGHLGQPERLVKEWESQRFGKGA